MRLLCQFVIGVSRHAPDAMSSASTSMLAVPSSSCTVAVTRRSRLSVPLIGASVTAVAVAAGTLATSGACWATSQSAICPVVG